ncbi:MAG: hypothetical protein AAF366_12850 [Pseudomonadota bacterium]
MNTANTVIEVLLAWAVGLTIAGLVYGPIIAIAQGADVGGILAAIVLTPTNLLLSFTIGAMISTPLMVLGVLAAHFIGVRAAERPLFWTGISTLGGTVFFGLGDAVARGGILGGGSGLIRPPHPVIIADLTIIALAVFGGSLFYCRRLRARLSAIGGDGAGR